MRFSGLLKSAVLSFALSFSATLPSYGISIIWNYDYDTTGFFTPERRSVLALAAAQFNHLRVDSPDLPPPTGDGTYWNWNILDPSSGTSEISIPGNLQAGTVTIYVGAYDLGGTTLGRGGPASWDADAFDDWWDVFDTLDTADAFKPFAGTLSLSNSSDFTWYSGLTDDIPLGQIDLYSVVLHELGHIFGIGTSEAWNSRIVGGFFVGENVQALSPGGVPVAAGHFVDTEWEGNPLLLNAGIIDGYRYEWSDLETAVLMDLGYVAIPEPATVTFAMTGFGLLLLYRRRLACKA